MSFLNAILLGGTAAWLAPLVIHLLNRTRFQIVDWGAMHLLEAALQVNSRRLHFESLLLLLIRCLIPVLLACTLARPVLTKFKLAGADAHKSLVLMLDNSLSMDQLAVADSDEDTSLLDKAKRELAQIVADCSSAELSLWTSGTRPVDQLRGTSFNPTRVNAAVSSVTGGCGASKPAMAVLQGMRQLRSMSNPNKQLILASDFQASEWRSLSASDLLEIKRSLAERASPIQLLLLAIAPKQFNDNLSISFLTDRKTFARVGEMHRVTARVDNHGRQEVSEVRVVFQVDGQDLTSRRISLPAGASEQVDFAGEFSQLGWHVVRAHVEDPSSLHGDDLAYDIVRVTPAQRIVIIDRLDQRNEFSGASRFLRLALAPFAAGNSRRNPFHLEVVDERDLRRESLSDVDVVIIAAATRVNDQAAELLEQFVLAGGGLLLFASQGLDTAWANRRWHEQVPMLPLRFGDLREAAADKPASLASGVVQAKSFGFFNEPDSGLTLLQFTKWYALESEEKSNPSVILKLVGGQPWLAGHEFGQGYVLQCATSCADDWSNMPLKAVFVPLAQTLVESLIQRGSPPTSLGPGESIELFAQEFEIPSPTTINLSIPNGPGSQVANKATQIAVATTNGRALFDQTFRPGLYRVDPAVLPPEVEVEPMMFSVAAENQESNMELLNQAELRELSERLGARLLSSADEYIELDKLQRDGREVWRWCLAGVLTLLFLELVIAQRISRGGL